MVSRPNLSFPVSLLALYNANPSKVHIGLARQLLQYVRKTSGYSIEITNSTDSVQVAMYADASFNTNPDNAKSFSGYIIKVNGSTISWSLKRQSCVARSTCEAEYIAASRAASHLVWTRQALSELTGTRYNQRVTCWSTTNLLNLLSKTTKLATGQSTLTFISTLSENALLRASIKCGTLPLKTTWLIFAPKPCPN
jgi:hypothetical protein